jgi:hypothetical protein
MADKKGYTGFPSKLPKNVEILTRSEVLGLQSDMLLGIKSTSGDPFFISSGTLSEKPSTGYKKNRIFAQTDKNTKGIWLDDGTSLVNVARRDVYSGAGTPTAETADQLYIKTSGSDAGIWHDTGSSVSRIANLNTRVIPKQWAGNDTSTVEYNSDSWQTRHSLGLPAGTFTAFFSWEVKGIDGSYYNVRVRVDSSTIQGGGNSEGFRQDTCTNSNYSINSTIVSFDLGSSGTIYLEFGGAAARGCYIRNSFYSILEYAAGG